MTQTVEVTTASLKNREANRRHYHRNRERRISEMRQARLNPRIRASLLVGNARKRAEQKQIPFDLDLNWAAQRLEAGVCEASGLKFEMVEGRHPFAPSLDRIDPTKGYTKDNTKVVVWAYNAAKGIASHEDVLTLAKALINAEKETNK